MSPELENIKNFATVVMAAKYPDFAIEADESEGGSLRIFCLRRWSNDERGDCPLIAVKYERGEYRVQYSHPAKTYKTERGAIAYIQEKMSRWCNNMLEHREQVRRDKEHSQHAKRELEAFKTFLEEKGLTPRISPFGIEIDRTSSLTVTTPHLDFYAEVRICEDGRAELRLRYPTATRDIDTIKNAILAM